MSKDSHGATISFEAIVIVKVEYDATPDRTLVVSTGRCKAMAIIIYYIIYIFLFHVNNIHVKEKERRMSWKQI